jgi:hypothetical protein
MPLQIAIRTKVRTEAIMADAMSKRMAEARAVKASAAPPKKQIRNQNPDCVINKRAPAIPSIP